MGEKPVKKFPHQIILVTETTEAAVSNARKLGKKHAVCAGLDQDYGKMEKPVKKTYVVSPWWLASVKQLSKISISMLLRESALNLHMEVVEEMPTVLIL